MPAVAEEVSIEIDPELLEAFDFPVGSTWSYYGFGDLTFELIERNEGQLPPCDDATCDRSLYIHQVYRNNSTGETYDQWLIQDEIRMRGGSERIEGAEIVFSLNPTEDGIETWYTVSDWLFNNGETVEVQIMHVEGMEVGRQDFYWAKGVGQACFFASTIDNPTDNMWELGDWNIPE